LPPDIKRSVKQALRSLSLDPFSGAPLMRELSGRGNIKSDDFALFTQSTEKRGFSKSTPSVIGASFTKD
jgi:hypothetical protein